MPFKRALIEKEQLPSRSIRGRVSMPFERALIEKRSRTTCRTTGGRVSMPFERALIGKKKLYVSLGIAQWSFYALQAGVDRKG